MKRPAIHIQILLALFFGFLSGIFFGDLMAPLERVGTAFILLLKMTVVPFMSVALIQAIGSLSPSQARTLFRKGFTVYLIFWASTILVIYTLSLALPSMSRALYHANSAATKENSGDLLQLFIPSNPFYALAHDVIPAIVLFSILFGVALMRLDKKGPVLEFLQTTSDALVQITQWIIQLSPVGIFALIASTAGTLEFHNLGKIQIYLALYLVTVLVLAFWIFPGLIAAFTPIRRRDFFREMRPALLIGFTTGNVLVALPYLMVSLEQLCESKQLNRKTTKSTISALVPISYNFPTAGNLLGLLFVLFLAFFYAIDFSLFDHFKLVCLGLFALFGAGNAVINALTFLLDKMQLPIDGLSLFLETMVLTRNFQALVSLVGMATVALLVCFAGTRPIRKTFRGLLKAGVPAVIGLLLLTLGLRLLLPSPHGGPGPESSPSLEFQQAHTVLNSRSPNPPGRARTLAEIIESGLLKVGYLPRTPPFSYLDEEGRLNGFDMAIAHHLAFSLNCSIEFVPFSYESLESDLNLGSFDVAMGALSVTSERLQQARFTEPYHKDEKVFITLDHRRHQFEDSRELRLVPSLTLGSLHESSVLAYLQESFPLATLRGLEQLDAFVELEEVDAVVWTLAEAKIWVLSHPAYTIVLPSPSLGQEFYAYAVQSQNTELLDYLDYWLGLKKKEGLTENLYRHWVLEKKKDHPQRWSIIRDYLHWVP